MEKYTSLVSGGLFTIFFGAQSLGYLHGNEIYGKLNTDVIITFGVFHLSHFFQPHAVIAWPFSPTICGILLLILPFLEETKTQNDKVRKNLVIFFISTLIPLSISIIEVSIIGPEIAAKRLFDLNIFPRYSLLLSFIYFSIFCAIFIACFINRNKIQKTLKPIFNYIPFQLIQIFLVIWLIYGCYIGSRLDGTLDNKIFGEIRTNENSLVEKFFLD